MRQVIREIREDLNRLVMQLLEVESYLRELQAGKVEPPSGFPRRSHTGTWKGRALREAALEAATDAVIQAELSLKEE